MSPGRDSVIRAFLRLMPSTLRIATLVVSAASDLWTAVQKDLSPVESGDRFWTDSD